ncbi:AAA family ATPase [Patescibacteria group bacterium AH-259-L07]|nr:AAA family ATPase [Patescibacteria group bacterium AH-259-L07]
MIQKQALDILKLGHNVYVTGPAGSGKTFLLNEYIDFLKSKGVGVGITASTGIAATHMNGITIHSWSGLGIKDELSDKDMLELSKKRYLARRAEKTKVLIIDEASMLHSFRLDMVDMVCKMFKQNLRPFGGMQVVLCGDFFQLPPINRNGNDAIHFIDKSQIWQNMNLRVCYLDEQYRHNDDTLMQVLNDIRTNNVGEHTLEPLRKRYKGSIAGLTALTKLYTHNIDVDFINNKELEKLHGEAKMYSMDSMGNRKLVEILKKSCLAPEKLILKKEAMVMFVKNNFDKGYVNGTLGKVIDFDYEGLPVVKTFKGKKIIAVPESWRIEEDGNVKAEIVQIPLRLAWAITVHKSQGMTLDAAEIDLSKSFVEGMGYVALSRMRSLEGLRLMGLNKMALKVNKRISLLDKQLIEASEISACKLQALTSQEIERSQKTFLHSLMPKGRQEPSSTYEKTKLLVEQKLSIKEIAKRRGLSPGTIVGHLETLLSRRENCNLDYLRSVLPRDRFQKIKIAFEKTKDTRLSPVRKILGHSFSYDELRLARLFLGKKKII